MRNDTVRGSTAGFGGTGVCVGVIVGVIVGVRSVCLQAAGRFAHGFASRVRVRSNAVRRGLQKGKTTLSLTPMRNGSRLLNF